MLVVLFAALFPTPLLLVLFVAVLVLFVLFVLFVLLFPVVVQFQPANLRAPQNDSCGMVLTAIQMCNIVRTT